MQRKQRTYIMFSPLWAFLFLFIYSGCKTEEAKQYKIGFSQCVESDLWRKTMLNGMKRELSFHANVTFIYRQADGNSQKQISQVKELLKNDIDLLIISPNEAEPLTPIVEQTFRKGIPVIVVDRKISTPLYSAYVGGDNYQIGKMAGQYAANILNGKGKMIEITGLPKSSAAIERHKGFIDAITDYPSLEIVKQVNGEWLKEKAQDEMKKIANSLDSISLVFAHNDRMALGTYEVYSQKESGRPKIIGVDGLLGKDAGLDLVSDKRITATMLYPTQGEECIRIALKMLNGEDFEKDNLLQTTVIDSSNVHIMKMQSAKAATQQNQIERQQAMLHEQQRIYNNQSTLLYVMITSLALMIALGGLAFFSLTENRKINKKLLRQNEEILKQKVQLEEMSAKAQEANEAKVNFFTNISHEFRTPLTLILGPLEELLDKTKNQFSVSSGLLLIQKNVIRLMKLMDQILDFRKIEIGRMKLQVTENNLVTFVTDIVQPYKSIAHKRGIDLRLFVNETYLPAWFDVNLLDKVIFNLLSNAIKFTRDNGYIHVSLSKSADGTEAIIKVEDNGVGMSAEALEHLFEAFYQGDYENYKGSGLGLALSKELIELHKGRISVKSEKGKGSFFEIYIRLGNLHFSENELSLETSSGESAHEQEKMYITGLDTYTEISKVHDGREKEHTILIIEDNLDLRNFLSNKLYQQYQILEAGNGQSALQLAFDFIPDLIICDLVIPGKDGIALTNIFKNDIRTSHIPIILLTAKTSIEQQIEGMKNKADAYITKPFNVKFLLESIKSMLSNRARLKDHLSIELPANLKTQTIGKLDRKFISEFNGLIEENISNEDFKIDEICRQMGISRMQLYRKVKALLNININDYIVNIRMQKAKYLLQHDDLPIAEIAFKVGFSSPAYFSNVFKAKFGVTPKEFKSQ